MVETNAGATLPATESISSRFRDLDTWDPATILEVLWEGQLAAVAAVRSALPAIAQAAEASWPRLRQGGRLVYAGAGTSGRIGVQDGAELPPTFDWPQQRLVLLMAGGEPAFTRAIENAEDDRDAAIAAIAHHAIGPDDVVLGTAASGNTAFTTTAIAESARRGALTIGIANSPGGTLLQAAAHPILVETGAEAIAGSTRMKAGTAQKIVLNLFSTLVMVRLGRVHQGLMVDMQARNEKLRRRAQRMLHHLTGRDDAAIRTALDAAGGRVKTAVLILEGLDRTEAESLLERSGGVLRTALADLRR
ncbi:N-acetylmuramic acid 6-phosphate etherase [Limobrevibacterium gyesilva]|uniref:N-acetylmuramic acid 6-phosphate etherase n=1 Tax=Limobrevibacterium gyesilva TaxID=2991712 RepID=A0AA41YVG0_9PROT|nr:N-acetylmuramic acid 6-phosphate etherase [Limobrevibacterium gyesilva]MCW3476127.1 N-acetylmuramic acid 6-phosphate etherase [Limobrevibacterium gyesilva]